jgi:hypothetical protein
MCPAVVAKELFGGVKSIMTYLSYDIEYLRKYL